LANFYFSHHSTRIMPNDKHSKWMHYLGLSPDQHRPCDLKKSASKSSTNNWYSDSQEKVDNPMNACWDCQSGS
jgi:hypothetical protein